jgi:hypothetical protein
MIRSIIITSGLIASLLGSAAFAGMITPGAPAAPGTDTFTFTEQGTGKIIVVTVVITPAIVAAALAAGVKPADVFAVGGDVKLLGYDSIAGVIGSKESSTLVYGATFSDPTGPALASLGYQFAPGSTTLGGLDPNGGEATYTAGFSFTDSIAGLVSLTSTLSFSQLSNPTLDGLLTAQFNAMQGQLSAYGPAFAGFLSLDLAKSSIDLRFPSTVLDGSVTTDSKDISIFETQSIASAPEPSGVVLVTAGLAGLGWWRRRTRLSCRGFERCAGAGRRE